MPADDSNESSPHILDLLKGVRGNDLRGQISEQDDLDENIHQRRLRRQAREDDYGVEKAIKSGIKSMVKVLALCGTIAVLIVFVIAVVLAGRYVWFALQAPDTSLKLFLKIIEWGGVLLSGLYLDGLWRRRKDD